MVKDHTDSEKGNPLPPHRLLLSINSKGSFIYTIPQTGYHIPRPLLHQSWSTGWNDAQSEFDKSTSPTHVVSAFQSLPSVSNAELLVRSANDPKIRNLGFLSFIFFFIIFFLQNNV